MPSPLARFTNRPARTKHLTFPLDPMHADRYREARTAVERAETRVDRNPDQAAAHQALHEAREALRELEAEIVTIRFDLVAIGPERVEELMREHPPTKAQKAEARAAANGDPKAEPDMNPETFPPALLAEAITAVTASDDPDNPSVDLDIAEVTALWESGTALGTTDRTVLYETALLINQAPSLIEDLGKD